MAAVAPFTARATASPLALTAPGFNSNPGPSEIVIYWVRASVTAAAAMTALLLRLDKLPGGAVLTTQYLTEWTPAQTTYTVKMEFPGGQRFPAGQINVVAAPTGATLAEISAGFDYQ